MGKTSGLIRCLLLVAVALVAQGAHGIALGGLEPAPGPPSELPYPAVNPIVKSERADQLAGSSAVTPAGQYTYRIPIDVPPGRAGVQPGLALVYASSAATNGLLGVGWSLEGASEIRRCRKTRATEGLPAGIGFTNADSFCLDGRKLVRLGGGDSVSLEGAEFRLEQDAFAKIVAHGDSGLGPESFTVYEKGGTVHEYSTRIAPHRLQGGFGQGPATDLGSQRMVWLRTRTHDRAGNAMKFDYDVHDDPITRGVEARLKSITYTETPDGKPGKRRVDLHYTEDRPDPSFAYQFGVRWESRSRLDKITLHGPDPVETGLLGEVRLAYTTSKDSGRSLLSSVTRCDGAGVCLRSKSFHWWQRAAGSETGTDEPPLDFEQVAVTPWDTAAQNAPDALLVADFTGDGLDDILYRVTYYDPDDYRPIYLSPAHRGKDGRITFGPEILINPQGHAPSTIDLSRSRAADMDGDGRADLFAAIDPFLDIASPFVEPGYISFRWDASSQEFKPWGDFLPGNLELDVVQLADVDGDGLTDVLREQPDLSQSSGAADLGQWLLGRNDHGSFPVFEPTGQLSVQGSLARAMDLDGDGRAELLPIDNETVQDGSDDSTALPGATIALGLDDSGDIAMNPVWRLRGINRMELVDLNGDGLRDAFYPFGPDSKVRWNLGNGFGPLEGLPSDIVPVQSTGVVPELGLRGADMDGDGIEDLISFTNKDTVGQEQIRIHRFRPGTPGAPGMGGQPGQPAGQIVTEELGFPGVAPLMHKAYDGSKVQDGWPHARLGDFDGDGAADIVYAYWYAAPDENGALDVSFQLRALIQQPRPSDVILEVQDEDAPLPAETVFYDRNLPDASPTCVFPQFCVKHGVQVVTLTATAAGGDLSGVHYKRYSFEDPRVDLWGRGFLGFGKVSVFDPHLRAETLTTFDHATRIGTVYPYAGLPANTVHIAPIFDLSVDETEAWPDLSDGPLTARVTSATSTYELAWTDAAGTFTVRPVEIVTVESELPVEISGDHVEITGGPDPDARRTTVAMSYDGFGNVASSLLTTHEGTYQWTTTTHENRVEDWLLGLPLRSEVTSGSFVDPLVGTQTRVTEYEHDSRGLLKTVTVEPDLPELREVTRYLRNDEGLPERVTVAASGEWRASFTAYDEAERMFPVAEWNSHAHYTRHAYHPGYGVPVLTEDPNGVQTAFRYDGFARPRRVEPAGGTGVSISYLSQDCKTDAAKEKGLCTAVVSDDGAESVAYTDELGRTWESGARGFDGELVYQRTRYNLFGLPVRQTRPFTKYAGATAVTTFDSLGRPRILQQPDLTKTVMTYSLAVSTVEDPNGHVTKVHHDRAGRTTRSEVAGVPVSYRYGPFDRVVAVEDVQGNVTSMEFDARGRRKRLDDPDQGITTFEHNGFGELTRATHFTDATMSAADQITEYHYDDLGRLTRRIDTEEDGSGGPPNEEVTRLDYDGGPHGRGKLSHTQSPDGVETYHSHDAFGRPDVTEWRIDGASYKVQRVYDPALGRLAAWKYPAPGPGAPRFEVGLDYNAAGWLRALVRPGAPFPAVFYEVKERELDGQLHRAEWTFSGVTETWAHSLLTGRVSDIEIEAKAGDALLGLSYKYDPAGHVTRRTDTVTQREESYHYDGAARLKQWTLHYPGPGGATAERLTDYEHDDLGNVIGVRVNGLLREVHDIDPLRPHRLAGIDYVHGAGWRQYGHDVRGRNDTTGAGRHIDYTPLDLPRYVSQPGAEAHFAYDASGTRVKKESTVSGELTTTVTIGGLYERRERLGTQGMTVEHVYYLHGEDGPVAQITMDEATAEEHPACLGRDRLGSVGVVFDNQGTVLERPLYEPFGRRVGVDGAMLPVSVPASGVALGFTGERHDGELELIDLHGRVYDPVQKRFLTADPLVPSPLDAQSYNRYAYVRNNPLNFTDPSGYQERVPGGIVTVAPWALDKLIDRGVNYLKELVSDDKKEPAKPPVEQKPPTSDGRGPSPPTGPASGPGGARPPPPPPPPPKPPTGDGDKSAPDPGLVPYNTDAQRAGGFIAGAVIGGVPYGGVVAALLIRNGVLKPGTSQAREGLAEGMAIGGIVWGLFGLSKPVPPQELTPAAAGGGPAPPAAVQTSGAGAAVVVQAGQMVNALAGIEELTVSLSKNGGGDSQGHHVATNKNYKAGEQWSKKFEDIFAKAGLTLKDPNNLVDVQGHVGPHPPRYHEIVHDRLEKATTGLSGDAYREALLKELNILAEEIKTPGTELNSLVTKQ